MGLKGAGARLCLIEGLFSATRYAAIMTADGSGEQSGDDYVRATLSTSVMALNNTTGQILNNAAVNFPAPGATWIDTTWGAIMSAATAGDVLFTMTHVADVEAAMLGADIGWATGELEVNLPASNARGKLTLAGYLLCQKGGLLNGTRYLSLHTGDPGTTRANELSGGSYAAQPVALANWTVSTTTGLAALNTAISWPVLTTDLPDSMYVALNSAVTGGNVLWSSSFANDPDDPDIGDVLSFPINGIRNLGVANDNDGI